MSRTLELPDDVYEAVERAAAARGLTPVAWVAAHLPPAPPPKRSEAKTLADEFEGYIGVIASGRTDLSADTGKQFADLLEEKYRDGRI